MSHEETNNVQVIPEDKEKTKKIWKVAGILAVVTIIEFIFAFTLPRGIILVSIFLGLTVVKAFYIVAEFMHLKHEQKGFNLVYLNPYHTDFVVSSCPNGRR